MHLNRGEVMTVRVIPYVLAYLVKDDKVLLSLRGEQASFGAHKYALIGGKVDLKESPTDALKREVFEEVGSTILSAQMKQVLYFKGHTETCVAFTYEVAWQGEPMNKEPEKHESIAWFSFDELPKSLLVRHRYIIECLRDGVQYAEWGF